MDLASLKDAIKLKIVLPVDMHVVALNVDAYIGNENVIKNKVLIRDNNLPCATRIRLLISGKLPDRKEQNLIK